MLSLSAKVGKYFSRRVVVIPGDGIGPEITEATIDIINASQAPIEWDYLKAKTLDVVKPENLQKVKDAGVSIKGPTTTPIGGGYRSINVALRKQLELYANVRPAISIPNVGLQLYGNVDLLTVRENTEGEYSGLEHEVVPGVIENLKIISVKACERVAKYAFEAAQREGRKKVSAIHKATVMRLADGLFLDTVRKVREDFPDIEYTEQQVDTAALILVQDPSKFDVMVMPNLYGDILSDLGAGLIGGLGLTPSANIGDDIAVFEAVHGSAPDIAGKALANPTALILSGVMMLRYLELKEHADRVEQATKKVLSENISRTRDLGGDASTFQFAKAVIDNL